MYHSLKPFENKIRKKILTFQHTLWFIRSLLKNKSWPVVVNKILCVELNYIGDLIAITPALRALKQKYPNSNISLLTLKGMEDVLWGNPNISNIITEYDYNDYDLLVVFYAGRFWNASKLYQQLKHIHFKIGVTNHGIFSSFFPNLNLKVEYKQVKHIVEDNLDVVRLIGADTNNTSYDLFFRNEHLSELKRHPSYDKHKPFIILHPGSKNIYKIKKYASHWWPPENWYQIGKYFSKRFNVIITGSNQEKFLYHLINKINSNNSFIDAIGWFDINGLKNIINKAKLVISIDSGPVHIASAFRTPVISLMGPQNPNIWKPLTNNGIALSHAETFCKKLKCKKCHNIYMPLITVDEVIKTAETLLKYNEYN